MLNNKNKILYGRNILIVEDDYLIASDMVFLLEEHGAIVIGPEASVATAMQHIDSMMHIDAAILDINLGQELVYPVADALFTKNIPFMFTTGYDANSILLEYLEFPRCQKPVAIGKILAILEGIFLKN